MSSSTLLAELPQRGMARICPTGCIHLTYGCITLDFHHPDHFEEMAQVTSGFDPSRSEDGVCIRYGYAMLRFTSGEFHEFSRLVSEAHASLRQVNVLRQLLA